MTSSHFLDVYAQLDDEPIYVDTKKTFQRAVPQLHRVQNRHRNTDDDAGRGKISPEDSVPACLSAAHAHPVQPAIPVQRSRQSLSYWPLPGQEQEIMRIVL
jgi:hypothetical protein